ncbi:unnamed protein product [marine sediment metagenome]|uniref:Uncharacterized protein n=1 Tax=marine sediment metagenome TaxID=412755 RepID=X1DYM8_9ZZZZ
MVDKKTDEHKLLIKAIWDCKCMPLKNIPVTNPNINKVNFWCRDPQIKHSLKTLQLLE